MMWKATTASYVSSWEKAMLKIKEVNEKEFMYLIRIPPRFWIKSRYITTPICDSLVNNMSEVFKLVI